MTPLPLDTETIVVRLNGIQGELAELARLAKIPLNQFAGGDPFKLAQYHLHRALEGVFHIAAHILSRLPGGYGGGAYKEMARLLGEKGIVDRAFADQALRHMAGYRNRLVHFYAEMTPREIYDLMTTRLGDIETFCVAVKAVLQHPAKYGIATASRRKARGRSTR